MGAAGRVQAPGRSDPRRRARGPQVRLQAPPVRAARAVGVLALPRPATRPQAGVQPTEPLGRGLARAPRPPAGPAAGAGAAQPSASQGGLASPQVKQKENGAALRCFQRVVRALDALGWEEQQLALVTGLLAGNVFDWGAKAVSE